MLTWRSTMRKETTVARPLPPTELEERAARKLCVIRGIDPEERVSAGPLDGSGHAVCVRWFRWHYLVLTEVRPFIEVEKAVRDSEWESSHDRPR